MRIERAEEEARNLSQGNPGDVDFIGMVRQWREEHAGLARGHDVVESQGDKICVCVRKRPLNDKERKKRDHDAVTVLHPTATVHSAKVRVDGISKYLDHNSFRFDHAFDEETTTEEVYNYMAKPLVDYVCGGRGARATVFAYGQTGSGKTFTMGKIQEMVAGEIIDVSLLVIDKSTIDFRLSDLEIPHHHRRRHL
jgi:kinesin family protein 2/24